jgi:methyl-accepting chemotaxis protein
VINKKFQYQYSMLIAAIMVLGVNIFLIVRMLFPGEQPLLLTLNMIIIIATVELALVGATWYLSLKSSHRIAGPVYVFSRDIERFCNGELDVRIRLRKKDMFQEEAEQINASFAALANEISSIRKLAQDLQQAASSGESTDELVRQLNEKTACFKSAHEA